MVRMKYGVSWAFAAVGVAAWVGWIAAMWGGSLAARSPGLGLVQTSVVHAAGLLWLCLAIFLTAWLTVDLRKDLLAPGSKRAWLVGGVGVLVICVGQAALCRLLGVPQEPHMARLFTGMNAGQVGLFLATVFIVAPVAEELAFRHFLLGVVPHRQGVVWATVGTLLTAAVFAWMHAAQYVYPTTIALMFALGVTFAVARIVTGGLVLPVTLHAMAVALGLVLNELR